MNTFGYESTGLDKASIHNRMNQLNPNHRATGPGRPAGYQGTGTKLDLDNHANQLNPNSEVYASSRNQIVNVPSLDHAAGHVG